MRQTFFIGTLLPNLNDIIKASKVLRGNWSQYAEMKTLYGSICKHDIRAANIQPVTRPVAIHCRWQEKNMRRDLDGITTGTKFIFDALVTLDILGNDGWLNITAITHEWIVDAAHPGVTVTMETV